MSFKGGGDPCLPPILPIHSRGLHFLIAHTRHLQATGCLLSFPPSTVSPPDEGRAGWRRQHEAHRPAALVLLSSLCRFGGTAELCTAVRRRLGVRRLGLLWTPHLTHPEPGPTGGGGAPVHRLLRHQPRLQPVQVTHLQ